MNSLWVKHALCVKQKKDFDQDSMYPYILKKVGKELFKRARELKTLKHIYFQAVASANIKTVYFSVELSKVTITTWKVSVVS